GIEIGLSLPLKRKAREDESAKSRLFFHDGSVHFQNSRDAETRGDGRTRAAEKRMTFVNDVRLESYADQLRYDARCEAAIVCEQFNLAARNAVSQILFAETANPACMRQGGIIRRNLEPQNTHRRRSITGTKRRTRQNDIVAQRRSTGHELAFVHRCPFVAQHGDTSIRTEK